MSEIAVLSNPASGAGRAHARRRALYAATRRAGITHLAPARPCELPAALRQLAAAGTRLLAIDGGDGTVVAVVTALRRYRPFAREPVLAVLAGGSTNMIARDAGCRGAPAAALRRLATRWAATAGCPATVARRPLLVRRAGASPCYGFFLGGAAIPRVTAAARRSLYGRGVYGPIAWSLTLAWSLWRLMRGRLDDDVLLRPVDVRIACPEGPIGTAPRVAVLVTSLDRLLLGLRPLPPGTEPGVAVVNAHTPGLWRHLPAALRRRWPPGLAGPLGACRSPSVTLAAPAGWVLDGEPLDPPADGRLDVSASAPLNFLVV